MKFKTTTLYAAMLSAMVGIVGCSSGGGNKTDTTTAANVTGKITGFGSVYVDGVEFETNGTDIIIYVRNQSGTPIAYVTPEGIESDLRNVLGRGLQFSNEMTPSEFYDVLRSVTPQRNAN